ncbi:restriction endonuclease subunit S [Methylomonas koyamae]|uniref:restriction endonuclease subunit S n=1 Tax=Methylomonas koyamae TaxID=702114 RepID=UPI000A71E840|nr:restriction endonuclease subunit S [Methylomonas koyamae]
MSEASPFPTAQLADVVDILDNLRVPINGTERMGRAGTVPYYGANGFQGWIDRPLFNEPLILLAEDGGNFDDFATRPIAYRIDGPSWVNNHAHIIRAKTGVCQSFIFWSIVNKDIRKYIVGGTRTKLTQGELRRIEINLPIESEQEGIANVLDTLDTAIHETEAIIAKLKAVQQALLDDLLTRGIAANGELRPSQSEAPHLYKQSPLGWIPKEWDVRTLQHVADVVDPQPDHRTPREQEEGAPYIGIGDFDDTGEINITTCRKVIWSALEKQERRFSVRQGDIIYGKIGTIGQPKLLSKGRYALTANVLLIQPKHNSSFLFHFVDSRQFEKQILEVTNTTSQPALGIETVRLLIVPCPPVEEADAIAKILDASMSKLACERRTLNKLIKKNPA